MHRPRRSCDLNSPRPRVEALCNAFLATGRPLTMRATRNLLAVTIGCLLIVGCSSNTTTVRVAVPPRVNLHAYLTVGLVTFSSSTADADLERLSTQRFLQEVQADQPGTRVVELGRNSDV